MRTGIAHTAFETGVHRVQLGVFQTVRREPVDLPLAQMVSADHVAVVVLMTIGTGQLQLTIAGVVDLFPLLPHLLGRAIDRHADRQTTRH